MFQYKTWIEINKKAAEHNLKTFKSILNPATQLWTVVKSNAYGHGLITFSQLMDRLGVSGFCVDSVQEGLKLRVNGIKKPILVLGPTLSQSFSDAAKNNLTITISNFEALTKLAKTKNKPQFHIKIDSGMHRQGFYLKDLPKIIKLLKSKGSNLKTHFSGIYTHFASAKDLNYPTYTDLQFSTFKEVIRRLEKAGFKNFVRHSAATGGTLVKPQYHLDAVRIGIGLYGLWPSKELQIQRKDIALKPVLSWHSLISEIKTLKKGDYVGYDLVERVNQPTKIAIIPIGYWHGFPRSLSGTGEVLINGKRAKVIGRVSMDLIVVNANDISCQVGDRATMIGKQAKEEITAFDAAQKISTIHYELITRINPLIERIVK